MAAPTPPPAPPANPAPRYPPVPPAATSTPGAMASLHQAVAARPGSDETLSGLWIALIILAPVLAVLIVAFAFLSAFSFSPVVGLGLVGVVLLAVLVPAVIYFLFFFKLLKRMSAHFAREAQLRRALIDYLRARAGLDGRDAWVAHEVATMEAIHADSSGRDRPQSGALAVLAFIPILKWYLLYLLTKWPGEHDQRWTAFVQQGASALAKLGVPVVVQTWNPVPRRSFALYLVLTLITGGLFSIYWYYTFIKDGNDHFQAHAAVEGALAASLR